MSQSNFTTDLSRRDLLICTDKRCCKKNLRKSELSVVQNEGSLIVYNFIRDNHYSINNFPEAAAPFSSINLKT